MSERAVPEDRGGDTPSAVPGDGNFRLKRVFTVVVLGALLFVGTVLFFRFIDGPSLLAGWTHPPLVPGSGQVMYQGKPLSNAQLFTRPLKGSLQGAAGFCDEQGRFELMTDIQGQYIKGAYAGEHAVTVVAYGPQPGPVSAPPLFSPKEYAAFATSPLTIMVSRSPGENEFLIALEGEPGGMPEPGPGGPGGGGGPGAGGPGGGPPPSADEMVDRTFEEFDADKNDTLSPEEIKKISGRRGQGVEQADDNGDGLVDRAELKAAVQAFLDSARPSPRPEQPEEQP